MLDRARDPRPAEPAEQSPLGFESYDRRTVSRYGTRLAALLGKTTISSAWSTLDRVFALPTPADIPWRDIAVRAAEEGLSLNAWIARRIESAVGARRAGEADLSRKLPLS